MRRAIPVLVTTAGGLALLANFHTSSSAATIAAGSGTDTSPTTSTSSPLAGSGATSTTAPATSSAGSTRTVDGPVAATEYGDVQVEVVLNGSKIVDVKALQMPNDRARSARISQEAEPLLRKQVLQAQSAKIHLVSGATYTSDGYIRSLQAALSQASH